MIRPKEYGGCGHDHLTADEWAIVMEQASAVEDEFDFISNGYREAEALLTWVRSPLSPSGFFVAVIPIRLVYTVELP